MITEQQSLFLDHLYADGLPVDLFKKAKEAYIKAGYSESNRNGVYVILKKLRNEIIERNYDYIALHGAECISSLIDVMRTPNKPGADTIIKAVNSLMDRGGLGKKETQEVEIKAEKGIVVLPAKTQ